MEELGLFPGKGGGYNQRMHDSDALWDFYWEVRLQEIEDLGKREAILAASKLMRVLEERPGQPVRLLELGCGEGQIIGALVEAHAQAHSVQASVGVDYKRPSIEKCRRRYPEMTFIEGDFTDHDLLAGFGQFEIVLLVNALHEVFSAAYSPELGELDTQKGKQRVEQALSGAVEVLAPGGMLVLFDGLEPSGDIHKRLWVRFRTWQARQRFEVFANEYQPFRISYQESSDPLLIETSLRDFTRFITKSIFVGKRLWPTERLESYQYFNEAEFRAALARQGLEISELRTVTVNYEKWRSEVEIESAEIDYPAEHILIMAQKTK
jgi:SAM-dependent methyltransferase